MRNLEKDYIKIVIHGRGGQGCVTAGQIIAEAAYLSGNFEDVNANPSFGAERRGAPVQAYAKLSREGKIWDRSEIDHPDVIIVFDETVVNQDIASSLVDDGLFVINSGKDPSHFREKYNLPDSIKIVIADVSKMALEKDLTIDGNPVINTPILGLLSRGIPEFKLDYLKKVVKDKMGEKLGQVNAELIEQGYQKAIVS